MPVKIILDTGDTAVRLLSFFRLARLFFITTLVASIIGLKMV